MAHVILVHGVNHQLDSADTIEKEWVPALAGGVRTAGFGEVADRLWRDLKEPDSLDVRATFYGELFREPGSQGEMEGELAPEAREVADELALAYLRRAATVQDDEVRRAAEEELAALGEVEAGERMGARSLGPRLVARLARLPWLARVGMPGATWWNRNLNQVTRYLTDPLVRGTAQLRILELVDERTRAIVAHSLGSVVAYETCFRLERPLPLLVTIGSPLGLANVVYHRLRPQPPVFPPLVKRWVNVSDLNDVVAAEPDLGRFFSSVPEEAVFDGAGIVHNGRDAHSASAYLTAVQVGRPVGETLTA